MTHFRYTLSLNNQNMLRQRQLLKQINLISSLRSGTRLYSTTSTEISIKEKLLKLKESKNIPPSAYSELLKHNDIITGQEVEIVEEIIDLAKNDSNVSNESRVQLHNLVLKNLVKYDYSLSTIHQRELAELKGQVDLESMVEIIKHNPGRVKSSWELFETTMNTLEKDIEEYQELIKTVLSKLAYGDASEQEDGYTMNEKALLRSIFLLKNLRNPPEELVREVLSKALESEDYELIQLIGLSSLEQIESLEPNTSQLVQLWRIWDPAALSAEKIEANVDLLKKLLWRISEDEEPSTVSSTPTSYEYFKQLNNQFPKLATDGLVEPRRDQNSSFQQLVQILEDSGTLKNPDSKFTPLRVTLLKSIGMNKADYKQALYLYHDFIGLDKDHVDTYMSTMVNVSSYLSLKNNDIQQLQIAEALTPQPIPFTSLQAHILGYSAFDIEKSLEIFNAYIPKVPKEVNEHGVSIASLLTESLLVAYLSKRDREFAYLIHDGAIMNDIVTSETGKNRMKAIFKRYGQILGEEDDAKINELLKNEVLEAIRAL